MNINNNIETEIEFLTKLMVKHFPVNSQGAFDICKRIEELKDFLLTEKGDL